MNKKIKANGQFEEDFLHSVLSEKACGGLPEIDLYGEKEICRIFELALDNLSELNGLGRLRTYDNKNASAWVLYCKDELEFQELDKRNSCFLCGSEEQAQKILNRFGTKAKIVCLESKVYISDLFRAMAYVQCFGKPGIVYDQKELCKLGFKKNIPQKDAAELYKAWKENPKEQFVFSDAKTDEFKRLQQIELMILEEIDRICRANGIKYFLAGGTLLGAVRSGGFIPWDYDIDVMMTPKNYRKFCKAALRKDKKGLDPKFFLQTPETEKENRFFTKVRLNGTKMTTELTQKLDIHQGIFVDIFEHDYTANSASGQKIHRFATKLFRSLVYNKCNGTSVRGAKGSNLNFAFRAAATFLKTVLPIEFLEWAQFKTIRFFKNPTLYMYDGTGQNLDRGVFPAKWLYESAELEFEGRKYPVPKEYKKYLEFLYGDYEKPICVSKRHVSHDILTLDFGEYN